MTDSKRRRLVQEEQLGVLARRHHLAPPPPKLQLAANPLPRHPAPTAQRLVRAVQATAAIAHHGAARFGGDNLPFRSDAVLQRHLCLLTLDDWPDGTLAAPRASLVLPLVLHLHALVGDEVVD